MLKIHYKVYLQNGDRWFRNPLCCILSTEIMYPKMDSSVYRVNCRRCLTCLVKQVGVIPGTPLDILREKLKEKSKKRWKEGTKVHWDSNGTKFGNGWRSVYISLCGSTDGELAAYVPEEVTCLSCLRGMARRVGLSVGTPVEIISDRMKELGLC